MGNRLPKKKSRWLRWVLAASAAAAVVAGALLAWRHSHRVDAQVSPERTFPLPPYTDSPYLNTGPDAQYVGTAACVNCHRDRHASYLLTAHSRSLADLNPDDEPPDSSFEHKASGWTYRIHRDKGQMYHEEVLRTAEGKEIARLDLPIKYLVGSGHYSRSYVVEVDGFLHESPVTWYASKGWGMSPGSFDSPRHVGFRRPVTEECMVCHTGRVEPTDGINRLKIHDKVIGCENCHGPGSLHVALRQDKGKQPAPGEQDLTIVNPSRLTRPLLESICAECHLNGPARINVRGRGVSDFRPGRPLSDYHIDYHYDRGSDEMTVVGHMEQLRRSVCYQKSKDLTCLTCHDPHAAEKPKDPVKFYRDKCLACHTTQSCGKKEAERLKQDPRDNCITCHMPRGDTNIPHIAFTHHRIMKHPLKSSTDRQPIPELVPIDDNPLLSSWDRSRNLGLAYLDVAMIGTDQQYSPAFETRSQELLEVVYGAGLRDPQTLAALAQLDVSKNPARSKQYAQQILDTKNVSVTMRTRALNFLGPLTAGEGNCSKAIPLLQELVHLRNYPDDWGLLGECYLKVNRFGEAVAALEHALTLRPDNFHLHFSLAEAYRRVGNNQRAAEHREKADWLRQHGAP